MSSDFDIKSLIEFQPPKYLCSSCRAILVSANYNYDPDSNNTWFTCPVCHQKYMGTNDYTPTRYFNERKLEFDGLLAHSQRLARITKTFPRTQPIKYPHQNSNIRVLLNALRAAKQFVHFATYGISLIFVGALKMIGEGVAVRGLISNANDWATEELEDYPNDAHKLKVRLFPNVHPGSHSTMPHQKLIVIDGLIAFTGSANLTVNGWRKISEGKEHIEVVTNVQRVIELNNTLFSPTWHKSRADEKPDVIQCEPEIPF